MPKKKYKRPPRQPSPHYMTLQEVATLFCVNEITVRRARDQFARLRHTRIGKRTLILRADVDDLVRRLDRSARAAVPDNIELMNERRKA